MREIGGYFGLEQLISNEYYSDLIALNNGRNALLYLLKAKMVRKIYIPYYLCDSISNMLSKHNYSFEFYNIDSNFMPLIDNTIEDNEYLYIVNYFGQLKMERVIKFKQLYKNIILDNSQAFYQNPINGIDTLYTCRKFFGVSDGAYLSTDKYINTPLETDVSKDRMRHILGRYEGEASEYYNYFRESDASFKNEPLKHMSKLTHNILGAIDYEKVRQIRNENYRNLKSKLGKINKLKLITPEGPYAYPLYIENGTEVKKLLAKKGIYVPTLWSNVIEEMPEDSVEFLYATNILPLPCDQRYGLDDMKYLVEELVECIS